MIYDTLYLYYDSLIGVESYSNSNRNSSIVSSYHHIVQRISNRLVLVDTLLDTGWCWLADGCSSQSHIHTNTNNINSYSNSSSSSSSS